MGNHSVEEFPHGGGPDENVLIDFGVTRQGFVDRLREILLTDPPRGLGDADVENVLAACT